MRFPPLIEGRLIRRRQRFLLDVELASGEVVTASVPNTGSLLSCVIAGRPVWLVDSPSTHRKYRYRWLLVRPHRSLVCIDTSVPNSVVYDAARNQQIEELAGFHEYVPEVPYGQNSRVDLLCRVHHSDMLRRIWVEVKSTTLVRECVAYFPDAVTLRGRKHLQELMRMVEHGEEAMQIFFVQRKDCEYFKPADDIDPEYGKELRRAAAAGVVILALQADVTKRKIALKRQIPVEL